MTPERDAWKLEPRILDQQSAAIFVEVPKNNVVLFQAFIDLYEGIATVRTVDPKDSILCLITTHHFVEDCRQLLDSIQPQLEWKIPSESNPERWVVV